jgi:drug/metabolite transporter (DMT)-like permease
MGGFAVPYFWGLQYTQAVNAAVLNALGPVMILVIAAVTMGNRVGPVQLVGILFGVAGSLLIVFHGDLGALARLGVNVGDLLLMLAVFFWSCYTVALKRAPLGLDPFALMAALSGLTLPMLAPFYALEYAQRGGFELTERNLGIIFYTGVCSSIIAYLCWNRGVTTIGAARAGAAQYLMPVFGAVLAYLILGEAIEWYHWTGMVVIFAGIALSSRRS